MNIVVLLSLLNFMSLSVAMQRRYIQPSLNPMSPYANTLIPSSWQIERTLTTIPQPGDPRKSTIKDLLAAVQQNNTPKAQNALEDGVSINGTGTLETHSNTTLRYTPLELAMKEKHPRMVRFLLDNGANPLRKSAYKKNSLEIAQDLRQTGPVDLQTIKKHNAIAQLLEDWTKAKQEKAQQALLKVLKHPPEDTTKKQPFAEIGEPLLHIISSYATHNRHLERKVRVCASCEKGNCKLYCGKCKSAYYCSRECQAAAWPTHKKVCNK